jgi:hypothetical protein
MHLATEYFVRSGIAKKMLRIPCSLFVTAADDEKKVITITNGYRLANGYVVKHWFVSRCQPDQALPSIQEHVVSRLDDPHIVLSGHRLLRYKEMAVPTNLNTERHPMDERTYNHYADQFLHTFDHDLNRENWLWEEFIRIYLPHLLRLCGTIFTYRTEQDAANDQREIVFKHYPDRWLHWLKWRRYMLDFKGIPAELAFARDYSFTAI